MSNNKFYKIVDNEVVLNNYDNILFIPRYATNYHEYRKLLEVLDYTPLLVFINENNVMIDNGKWHKMSDDCLKIVRQMFADYNWIEFIQFKTNEDMLLAKVLLGI